MLLSLLSTNVKGQDAFDLEIAKLKKKYPVPKLTKAKMYADFDTLISIMERCNPQYLVRKKVTSYDMVTEMKAQRIQIENCNNTLEYINLLHKMLFLTLDEHCSMARDVWWYSYSLYKNEIKVNNIKNKDFGFNFHYQDYIYSDSIYPREFHFIYTQGKYILRYNTTLWANSDSIILAAGTEIITFNNQPANIYFNSIRSRGSQWDFNKKTYYNSTYYVTNPQNSIGIKSDNKVEEFLFTDFMQEEQESNDEFLFHWFAKDSVLYFRIPVMQMIDIQSLIQMKETFPDFTIPEWKLNFEKNVLSLRSQPIKSVIIDIRGNSGGNDRTWKELLLGLILKNPIEYPFCLIMNDDNDAILRYPPEIDKKIKYDFINSSHQFRVFEEEIDTIKPSYNNLGYEGTIYLLVDEDIYSSALAFASLNTKTNRIKTIGMPIGKLGGQGANASVFVLPHSRFMFTLDLFLDASSVLKTEEFYHDHINYPITPSIEYYKYWYDSARPYTIDEKNMYKHDEVFIKALEIIKKNQ